MATKFYNAEKTSEILGVPVAEVNQLRETHKLRGLRDGADWKFKAEEVEALALKMKGASSGIGSGLGIDLEMDDDADVLLSEVELGSSDPSASGTVIGPPPENGDFELDPVDSAVTNFEDLDLSIEESGLELASSGIGLGSDPNLDILGDIGSDKPKGHEPTGASSILGLADDDLDDDDLVLGGESGVGSGSGSGGGSDITLGGDSGISLIDPADSGISLEEPLDLSTGSDGSKDEGSLGLAGDSILSLAEDSVIESSSDLSSDGDDFMLSSMEDEEDDDSSQVIALEEEGIGSGIGESLLDLGDSSPNIGSLDSQVGFDMSGGDDEVVDLSESLGAGSSISSLGSSSIDFADAGEGSFTAMDDGSAGQAVPAQDFSAAAAAATGPAVAASGESGYTKLDYFFLYSSFFTLGIVGLLMYDIIRNIGGWNQAMGLNSSLIEMFKSLL